MKTRREIKEIAKENFTANYWPVVGISITFSIITMALAYTFVGIAAIPAIIVATSFFYIATYFGDTDNEHLANVINVGFEKFGRNFGSLLFRDLMLIGWCSLFLVPGIIKSYSYAMTSYILADCPNVKTIDAITLSRRMMDGHKWEYFVFQLSFIGWGFLSVITFGLVGVFYANPYQQTAQAGYYAELKKLVLDEGVVTVDQFAGAPLDPPTASTYSYASTAPAPTPIPMPTPEVEVDTQVDTQTSYEAQTAPETEATETQTANTTASGVVFEE